MGIGSRSMVRPQSCPLIGSSHRTWFLSGWEMLASLIDQRNMLVSLGALNLAITITTGGALVDYGESDFASPWEWVNASSPYAHEYIPLFLDDRTLLVLRFPKTFNLTNRAIEGEMRSLNPKSNRKYFGSSSIYEFALEKLVSKACYPHPYKETNSSLMIPGINVHKGNHFCDIFEDITCNRGLTILSNWKCSGKDEFCGKLGPFKINKEINQTDGGFKGVNLYMQVVKCEQSNVHSNATSARVLAVFRASLPSKNQYAATRRSGTGNMTVAAEGIWNSTSGQLCMFTLQPSELWNYFQGSSPSYSYSQYGKAAAILERNEKFSLGTMIEKSLLKFPKLEDAKDFRLSLSLLSEDLILHTPLLPDSSTPKSKHPRIDIQMDILAVGPIFELYFSRNVLNFSATDTAYHTKAEYTEKLLLFNVSAQLFISRSKYNNSSVLFLEGYYDQRVGKMYLVGCRDVRASWEILHDSIDLEAGLDCLIDVIVSYPPTTDRWLVDTNAKISIASQRADDDPLYFTPVKLQTFPITYRKQREDILSRRAIEGILWILALSFEIACAEALFKKAGSESYESLYDLENNRWLHTLDYTAKLLVMALLLLTPRLCQTVWQSHVRLLTRAPLEPHRIPGDKKVRLCTLAIHLIGYAHFLIIHSMRSSHSSIWKGSYTFVRENSCVLSEWEAELEEYVGLVRDLFLLPKVIGNLIWQVDCQPLRKLYYIGITLIRLFPRLYNNIRAPDNPYSPEEYEFVIPSSDFYSKFGDIAIPVTAVVIAVLVYVQQKFSYAKLRSLYFWKL
ncbi:hypothetical protein TorRG33x02_147720 [Trema orientale]|uniref:RING-type E3 ubiquitin transferase n=1 Tax=Trema orientale TaxID=63057 RepID=A0A2P5EV69_TREOI|nr:hypothetical protein TorRG33x02_147720 [Trema orientale]